MGSPKHVKLIFTRNGANSRHQQGPYLNILVVISLFGIPIDFLASHLYSMKCLEPPLFGGISRH